MAEIARDLREAGLIALPDEAEAAKRIQELLEKMELIERPKGDLPRYNLPLNPGRGKL